MNYYHLLLNDLTECKGHLEDIVKAFDATISDNISSYDGFFRYAPDDLLASLTKASEYLKDSRG